MFHLVRPPSHTIDFRIPRNAVESSNGPEQARTTNNLHAPFARRIHGEFANASPLGNRANDTEPPDKTIGVCMSKYDAPVPPDVGYRKHDMCVDRHG